MTVCFSNEIFHHDIRKYTQSSHVKSDARVCPLWFGKGQNPENCMQIFYRLSSNKTEISILFTLWNSFQSSYSQTYESHPPFCQKVGSFIIIKKKSPIFLGEYVQIVLVLCTNP
jgi:hypothetical protein